MNQGAGTVPVPDRQTLTGFSSGSFVANDAVALRAPAAEGLNVTVKLPVAPTPTLSVAGAIVKSLAFVPLTLGVRERSRPPSLRNVIVEVPVPVATSTLPPSEHPDAGSTSTTSAGGGSTQSVFDGTMVNASVAVSSQPDW